MKKYACVTGAGKGLGTALVETLLKECYSVVAAKHMDIPTELEQLKELYNEKLIVVVMDISKTDSVNRAKDIIFNEVPYLDLIINNAGVLGETDNTVLDEIDFDDINAVYNTNTVGSLRVTNALLPLLLKGEEKILLNISSEAGSIEDSSRIGWFAYCMSKAALNMQSAMLRDHLKDFGIHVITMHPGWVQTYMRGSVDTDATLTPQEAAVKIVSTIHNWDKNELKKHIFVDNMGIPMKW